MEQDLIALIKILGNLPGVTLWALGLFLTYKIVLYLSTTGAIIYSCKEIIKLLSKYLDTKTNTESKIQQSDLLYHGFIQSIENPKIKCWYYNEGSLEELAKLGIIEKFYTSKYRVVGY